MTDDEVMREYLRVTTHSGTPIVEVCRIEWDGPHTPLMEWHPAESLPDQYSDEEMAEAMARLAGDTQYFRRCVECNELNPCGHMHDERVCQGCAVRDHGVVY